MFYMDEILELLGGNDRLREKIAPRKAMYEKCLSYPQFPNIIRGRFDPDSWVKDPDRRQDYFIAGMNVTEEFEDGIKGFPGASGIVTGKAHVITDIRDANLLKEGEILVTCATNIEWTIYFPKVSAIVTDIGAPLSHAAIVAREFGIPAVVGCGNATTLIHTGDLLTVNGAAGTVSFSD